MSGSKDEKKKQPSGPNKDAQASVKAVEAAFRFKMGGGGLKGLLEAVPSLLKFGDLLGNVSTSTGGADIRRMQALQKKANKQLAAALSQHFDDIKRAGLKPMKPPKPMVITEKNAAKSFATLESATVRYAKLARKAYKINESKE